MNLDRMRPILEWVILRGIQSNTWEVSSKSAINFIVIKCTFTLLNKIQRVMIVVLVSGVLGVIGQLVSRCHLAVKTNNHDQKWVLTTRKLDTITDRVSDILIDEY